MRLTILSLILLLACQSTTAAEKAKRLFILSGQSNMVGLKPETTFTPTLKKLFPDDDIVVVKSAQGGQPIRRWHQAWQPPKDVADAGKIKNGDLYEVLMKAVAPAIKDQQYDSVVFVWMQGERDAKAGWSAVYAESLQGVIQQLRDDLKRPDMRFVIGRLSDNQAGKEGWDAVREAQVKVAEADKLGGWVDTDDLNGPKDDLHYTREGYDQLGERFAEKAADLIQQHGS